MEPGNSVPWLALSLLLTRLYRTAHWHGVQAQPPLVGSPSITHPASSLVSAICHLYQTTTFLLLPKLSSLAVATTLHNAACAEDHGALPDADAQRG